MSYMLSIDEISESALWAEILLRQRARQEGRCDYCYRGPNTQSCKYPQRHTSHEINWFAPECFKCAGFGRVPGDERCPDCEGTGLAAGVMKR